MDGKTSGPRLCDRCGRPECQTVFFASDMTKVQVGALMYLCPRCTEHLFRVWMRES